MVRTLLNRIAITSLLLCLQIPSLAQRKKETKQSEVPATPKSGKPSDVLKCAVHELTGDQRRALEMDMDRAARIRNASGRVLSGITYIPIRPHILRRNDGNGGYSI